MVAELATGNKKPPSVRLGARYSCQQCGGGVVSQVRTRDRKDYTGISPVEQTSFLFLCRRLNQSMRPIRLGAGITPTNRPPVPRAGNGDNAKFG